MESILAKIKGEKKLSFNSFRYRILHWSFFLHWPFSKTPKSPEESPLPNFLYTHYCPLFHLTNLLVFPGLLFTVPAHIVALIGVSIVFLACGVIQGVGIVFSKITNAIESYREWREKRFPSAKRDAKKQAKKQAKQQKKAEAAAAAERARQESIDTGLPLTPTSQALRSFRRLMLSHALDNHCFETFLYEAQYCNGTKYEAIFFNKEHSQIVDEWSKEWNDLKTRIAEQREIARKKKEMLRDRIIWWSNFSRIFIKGLLNCLYAVIAVATIYYSATYVIPAAFETFLGICHFIAKVFSAGSQIDFLSILKASFKWAMYTVAAIAGLMAIAVASYHSFKLAKWPAKKAAKMLTVIFQPVGEAAVAFGSWFARTFTGVIEFCAMFYETNCPPIIIVDENEERIAAEGEI